jgi:hypothetical protein
MAKVIKNKRLNEHVYWIFYECQEKVEVENPDPEAEKTFVMRDDKGWTIVTTPSLIVSQDELRLITSKIAQEGKFERCLICDFKLLISR